MSRVTKVASFPLRCAGGQRAGARPGAHTRGTLGHNPVRDGAGAQGRCSQSRLLCSVCPITCLTEGLQLHPMFCLSSQTRLARLGKADGDNLPGIIG